MKTGLFGCCILTVALFISSNSLTANNEPIPDTLYEPEALYDPELPLDPEPFNDPEPPYDLESLQQAEPIKPTKTKKSVIYQWVDENGNTVISDRPHEGAIEIAIPKPQTYRPIFEPSSESSKRSETNEEFVEEPEVFDETPPQISVVTPVSESWLDNNLGNVQISVRIEPFLGSGQQLVIKLDGKIISQGLSLTAGASGLERGSHNISVEVSMKTSGKVIASTSSTFFVRRPTVRR